MARRGAGARRAAVGIADQLLYSMANFALTVLVARSVAPAQFGSYSLIVGTYLIGIAVIRGFTSETLVVRYSASERDVWRRASGAAGGTALGLGILFGAGIVIASLFLGSEIAGTARVFGILFPGLVVQDFLRYAALTAGRPAIALLNDIVTVVVQFGVAAILLVRGSPSVGDLVAAWGGAAHVGAVVGMIALRVRPAPGRIPAWFRAEGRLAVRYATDDLASQTSQQGTAYAVAGSGGLAEAGSLRAAQTVFGPPSIFNLGVQAAVLPELVRVLRRSSTEMRRNALRVGAGLGVLGMAWGLMAVALPPSVGHALFGKTWTTAHPLIAYFVIAQAANGIRVGPLIGLRALGAANQTLRARFIVITMGLFFLMGGAIIDGAHGTAVATAIVTPVQAVVWLVEFEIAIRTRRREIAAERREAAWRELVESAPGAEAYEPSTIVFGSSEFGLRPDRTPAHTAGRRLD